MAAKLTGCSNWKCKFVTRSFLKSDLRCRMTGYFVSYSRSNFVSLEFDLMIPNSSKYGLNWAMSVFKPLATEFSKSSFTDMSLILCAKKSSWDCRIRKLFLYWDLLASVVPVFEKLGFLSFLCRERCVEISRLLSRLLPIFGHNWSIRCRSFQLRSDLGARIFGSGHM